MSYQLHRKNIHCMEDRHNMGTCNADLPLYSNSLGCCNHLWAHVQAPCANSSWALTSVLPVTCKDITLKYFSAEQPSFSSEGNSGAGKSLAMPASPGKNPSPMPSTCWCSNTFISVCSRYHKTVHCAEQTYMIENWIQVLHWEYQHVSPQLKQIKAILTKYQLGQRFNLHYDKSHIFSASLWII